MTEKPTEVSKRRVVGHKRDGRSCYDKEAKRELIEACLRPGVSIARMGLQHGINANLLRTWITRYRRQRELVAGRPAEKAVSGESTFVPVVASSMPARASAVSLGAQLPNGVKLELGAVDPGDLAVLLRLLWDRNGFWLLTKRLEQDRFKWPSTTAVLELSTEHLHWLLEGIDLDAMRRHPARQYQRVC